MGEWLPSWIRRGRSLEEAFGVVSVGKYPQVVQVTTITSPEALKGFNPS
jgi:hypothetical protein